MEKIGLALSGGGARSLCQIGVIKVLEKEGISIDVITGTSMGAIIGAIYSFTKNAEFLEEAILRFTSEKNVKKIERIFSRFKKGGFIKRVSNGLKNLSLFIYDSFKTGLFSSETVIERVERYFKKEFFFEDAKINLGITATQCETGKLAIFNKGKIFPAIIASSAIPGLITPVKINGKRYVDGGVISTIPVFANAFIGGEKIIGIENESSILKEKPSNTFEIFVQMEKIKSRYITEFEGSFCDLLLKVELPGVEWFNFSYAKRCIQEGERVCKENLDKIESFMKRESRVRDLREKVMEKIKDFFLLTESSV
ncbi:MAG TPA: patatin-like phospholipase family protein [Firmicutes bacterium]|nr:patatin-like phospholipase family protein [Bacillota bacterium]